MSDSIQQAVDVLRVGGIIAYPTEAVFGLGVNPANQAALNRLIDIKCRDEHKGFIIIAAEWSQLQAYVTPVAEQLMQQVLASWPGPNTWIMPAKPGIFAELTGHRSTLAVRVTAHPVATALCRAFQAPIVSTSANLSGQAPARHAVDLDQALLAELGCVVAGEVGASDKPTTIRDAVTGRVIRA